MGVLDSKPPQQVEMEKKIKALRNAGMTSSAERIQQQLNVYLNRFTGTEKVKPLNQKQLAKTVKEQKALAGKA